MASCGMDLDDQTRRGDKRRSDQQVSGSNKELRRADAVERPMFALDVSGSTNGAECYWTVAAQVLAAQNGAANVQPVLWDHELRGTTQTELEDTMATRAGNGATCPVVVVREILARNFHGHLLLITDGEIGQRDVDECDAILPLDWAFSEVDVYVINSNRNPNSVNVSVGCPFMRCAPTRVFVADATLQLKLVHVVTDADRSLLDTVSTASEFDEHFERIKAVVESCTRGLDAHAALRQQLLQMQRRLVASSAKHVLQGALYQLLAEGKTSAAEEAARTLIETNGNASLDDRMHSLLRMTQGALRDAFTIGGIRTAAAHYAPVQDGDFDDHACGIAEGAFERAPRAEPFTCPITFDDDVSQALMVYDTTGFWDALSTEQQRQVFACPLVLLSPFMKRQLAALVAQLGHVISVGAFRNLCSHQATPESPFTRRPIARAAICPGPSDAEMAATDIAIHQAFTAGRKLGNVEMWYIVLWHAVQKVPHLVDTPGFIENMRAQLANRFQHRKIAASLTGLDGTVNARLPVGAAIWFVVGTAHVHNQVVPGQEAIRLHLAYSSVLEKLCEMQGFAVSEQARAHVNRLKALSALYTACKFVRNGDGARRNATSAEQQAFFAKLKCLYQASRGQVLLDGPATPSVTPRSLGLPAGCWHVPTSELYQLSRMVDPQSKFGHTKLPGTWTTEPLPTPVTTWDYAYVSTPVPICPATARPWSASWQADAQTKFAVDSSKKLLPMHHWLMEYARKLNRFPTADELVLWVAGKHPTLHARVYDMAVDAIRDYQPLVATLPFADLMARYRASRSKEARARLEAPEASPAPTVAAA